MEEIIRSFREIPDEAFRILESLPASFRPNEFFSAGAQLGIQPEQAAFLLGTLLLGGVLSQSNLMLVRGCGSG